jgi:hypothetical protein
MVARTGLFVAPVPGPPAVGTSPTDGRLVLGALFGTGGGCLSGGAFTASATLMQVTIAGAVWRIPDPTNTGGVYLSPADVAMLNLSAGPASGSRIDVVWVRQNNFEAGDADSRVTYGVAAGTASSSPVAPAVPSGAMKIAQITVPTGASNAAACTIQPTFGGQNVAAPSIVVATEAQLPAVGAYFGQLAVVLAVTVAGPTFPIVERWNGAAWKRWDSDWAAASSVGAINLGSYGSSGGWTTNYVNFRYHAGRVVYEGCFLIGSSPAVGGQIAASLPVPAAVQSGTDRYFAGGGALDYSGTQKYALDCVFAGANVYFSYRDGAGRAVVTGPSAPFVWAQSDQVSWSGEYDPA